MPVARSMVLLLGLAVLVAGETWPCSVAAQSSDEPDDVTGHAANGAVVQPGRDLPPLPLEPDSTGSRYVAPALEVRGARVTPQDRLDRDAGFATVLDAASWEGQARSAADVLGRAVGVHVRDAGGVGGYSTLSLRGSTAAQVPVYLDGVLLNGPGTGELNLADVPLSHLERIEVYRGSAPLTLGGASIGGAVHLFSASGTAPLRASLAHGTHDTWNGEFAGATSRGDWQLQFRARAVRSAGDWAFHDDRGTLYNPGDDTVRARVNNDVRGGGILLSAARSGNHGRFEVSEMLDGREQGIPGFGVLQSETARSHSFTHQLRGAWIRPRVDGNRFRAVEIHHRTEVQGVEDPDADLGRSPRDREDRLHVIGARINGAATSFGERSWSVQLDHSRLRSRDDARLDGEGAPQTRWTAALALEPQLRLFAERLSLAPGLRLERHWERWHASPGNGTLPQGDVTHSAHTSHTAQLGVRYGLGDGLAVKANLGHFERTPTLFELFGDRGTAQGNPDLRAESGTNRDVGLVWNRPLESRRFALSFFWNDAFDLITFVRNSPATAKAFNVGRAEIEGLEVEADFGRFGPWSASASATRMATRDRTDNTVAGGKQLPGRPGYELEMQWGWHSGRFESGLTLLAMGDNYAQTGERAPVPSRVLLGLDARWRWRDDLAVLARVDNLGDAEVFDLWGYPLPQRRLTLAIQAGGLDAR